MWISGSMERHRGARDELGEERRGEERMQSKEDGRRE